MSNLPEQTINPYQFQQPVEKVEDKKPRGILFLELGIFEIIFVLFFLGIIFAALNFFNILSISKILPQLSFLPHLTKSQVQQPSSTQIQVNRDAQSTQLINYLKQSLKPSSLPFNIDSPAFVVNTSGNYHSVDWNINFSSASATLLTNSQTHLSTRMSISIGPISVNDISANSAQKASQMYLNSIPSGNFKCSKTKTFSYCENFISNSQEKSGFGLTKDSSNNQTFFFDCEIPSQSSIYQRSTSCLTD